MDTKSRSISFITKFICCLLCIGLFFGSGKMIIDCYFAANFFESDKLLYNNQMPDFISSHAFHDSYIDDVNTVMNYATNLTPDSDRKQIITKKADFIEKELKSFKHYKQNFDDSENDDSSDTTVSSFFIDYRFDCGDNAYWLTSNYVYYSNYEFYPYDSEEDVRAKLDNLFDDFSLLPAIPHYGDVYEDYAQSLDSIDGMYYYVVYGKTTISNLPENVTYKSVLNRDYAITYEDGKIRMSKNMRGFVLGDSIAFDDGIDAYFYVDTSSGKYAELLKNYNILFSKNIKNEFIGAVAGGLISVVLFVLATVMTGKRQENKKVKLAFIDYIPFGIHLALSAGIIGFGIFYFAEWFSSRTILGSIDYYTQKSYLLAAAFSCLYAVALEFFTSTVRLCKSDKKFYKGTLCYYIFLLSKKIIDSIKNKFSYKIENFKAGLIAAIVCYFLVNAVLLVLSFVFLLSYTDIGNALNLASVVLLVIFNIVCAVFVTRYVVDLDKIIKASRNNTLPQINRKKLPKSLSALLESLHYSKKELDAAVDKAVRDERMRTELITNVSHDIKTPITSIITYSDLLSDCDLPENTKEYVGVIKEKAVALKRLVDDLIEASKINAGVINLNPVNLSLSELVAEAVVEESQQFSDNGLDLIFRGDQTNVSAFADGTKTFRVVDNLLSNALKYSVKGSRVYADVYYLHDAAVFEIKNISSRPLNITPDELTKRFVRGDKSRSQEGNGLGLSIADSLCKAMGGCLNITIDGDLFKARMMLPKTKEPQQLTASVASNQSQESQENI